MKTLIAVLGLLLATLAQADVYKCKNASGQLEFQENPCPTAAGEKMKLQYQSVPDDPDAENISQEKLKIYGNHIARKSVVIGMTARMVRQSWGEPSKINVSIGSYGRSEQWVYENSTVRSDYIYIENGRVKSLQVSR